jgi:hypothetical protein
MTDLHLRSVDTPHMPKKPTYAAKLVELNGPNGKFSVASATARRELRVYLYQDEFCNFFFQAEIITSREIATNKKYHQNGYPTLCFDVISATVKEPFGPPISLPSDREKILRDNITHFFKTRNFMNPTQVLAESEADGVAVVFSWKAPT